jgi:hypothetical protein
MSSFYVRNVVVLGSREVNNISKQKIEEKKKVKDTSFAVALERQFLKSLFSICYRVLFLVQILLCKNRRAGPPKFLSIRTKKEKIFERICVVGFYCQTGQTLTILPI